MDKIIDWPESQICIWHCPQCLEWNELGRDYPKEDTVQCMECDSEFKYE